jgi:hypothetical protein
VSVALVAVVLATQVLAGWLALAVLAPDLSRRWTSALPRALLLGPLLVTLQLLAGDATGLPLSLPTLLAPWWALAALRAWRRRTRPQPERGPEVRGGAHAAALALAFALAGLSLGCGLLRPMLASDPLTNAGLVGRVVDTLGRLDATRLAALQAPAYVSYPPLIPLNEAALFRAAGGAWARGVMPFFALAHLALLLLLVEACFERLRPARALPLALLLLLVPAVAAGGATGYFDERFAGCVLLLGLTVRELDERADIGRVLLATAAAVACVLTKPHGLLVAGVAGALLGWLLVRGTLRARVALAGLALLAAGCALWPAFAAARGLRSPPDVTVHWPGAEVLAAGMGRALAFAARTALPPGASAWSTWGLAWPVLLALGLAGVLRRRTRGPAGMALAAAGLHLLGCAAAMAGMELDLQWSLEVGMSRWLLHVLPWAALAAAAGLEEQDGSLASA